MIIRAFATPRPARTRCEPTDDSWAAGGTGRRRSAPRGPPPVVRGQRLWLEPERHAFHLIGTAHRCHGPLPTPPPACPARRTCPRAPAAACAAAEGERDGLLLLRRQVCSLTPPLNALGVGPVSVRPLIDVSTIPSPASSSNAAENERRPPCRRRSHSGRRTHADGVGEIRSRSAS